MNAKQTVPIVATLAPVIAAAPGLLIIGGLVALAAWLLSSADKKKPENAVTLSPSNSNGNFVPPAPKSPVQTPPPIIAAIKSTTQFPLSPSKKTITREDMAIIFNNGARALTRKGAVAVLKGLGFGQTAAYQALLPDGRFASWLQFAPDGIIAWNN